MEILIGVLGLAFVAVLLVDVWVLRRRSARPIEPEPDESLDAVLHLPPTASGY
jgi:hypothetical protein